MDDKERLKKCSKCGLSFPISRDYFHLHRKMKDGFYSQCKLCRGIKKFGPYTGKRICSVCIVEYPDTEEFFNRKGIGTTKLRGKCKKCINQEYEDVKNTAEYKKSIKTQRQLREEKYALAGVSSSLKSRYGMTINDYVLLFENQGGVCAICGLPERILNEKQKPLSVDHDHSTGKIRGLLCNNCNRGLGGFKDDTTLLSKAVEYLRGDSKCG